MPLLHCPELAQQFILSLQFLQIGHLAVAGAVINEIIRILRRRIEGFHLHIGTGGSRSLILFQLRTHIGTSRQFDHLRQIIGALTNIGFPGTGNIEKCHCLSRRFFLAHRLEGTCLRFKCLLCLFFMTGQQSIQLDPLGSSQRILLIAGIIHHHRNIEFLQLLLDFRCVIDHGVFNSKSTPF